ncbi:MAG: hypothetical protein HQ539_03140 [Parcubacteria group bacterium]|nr:hypothetical protein [Parcubacteria group bacterium]
MAKQCAICGKGSVVARHYNKLRGKYNPTPKIRKYPNLQWLTVPEGTTRKKYKEHIGKRVLSCTKCIKALGKKR